MQFEELKALSFLEEISGEPIYHYNVIFRIKDTLWGIQWIRDDLALWAKNIRLKKPNEYDLHDLYDWTCSNIEKHEFDLIWEELITMYEDEIIFNLDLIRNIKI